MTICGRCDNTHDPHDQKRRASHGKPRPKCTYNTGDASGIRICESCFQRKRDEEEARAEELEYLSRSRKSRLESKRESCGRNRNIDDDDDDDDDVTRLVVCLQHLDAPCSKK